MGANQKRGMCIHAFYIIDVDAFNVFLYCLGDPVGKTELYFVLCNLRSNKFLPSSSDLCDKHQP